MQDQTEQTATPPDRAQERVAEELWDAIGYRDFDGEDNPYQEASARADANEPGYRLGGYVRSVREFARRAISAYELTREPDELTEKDRWRNYLNDLEVLLRSHFTEEEWLGLFYRTDTPAQAAEKLAG